MPREHGVRNHKYSEARHRKGQPPQSTCDEHRFDAAADVVVLTKECDTGNGCHEAHRHGTQEEQMRVVK